MKKKLLLLFFLIVCFKSIGQLRLVEDLIPGIDSSNPYEFIEHNGLLFFIGSSSSGGAIYMMDQSENIIIAYSGAASNMIIYDNQIYFNENNRLNRLNIPYGTGSTVVDSSISIWGSSFVYNGELYIGGELNQTDPLNPNYELMAFNGTTVRLVEEESTISLNPQQYVSHLGELYFVGEEISTVNGSPITVNRIYKTNGTSVEIVTTMFDNTVSNLTSLNNTLYFMYSNGDFPEPINLWYITNNNVAGFGDSLSFPFGLTVFDNKLYYYKESTNMLYARDSNGENAIPAANGLDYPSLGFPIISNNQMAFSGFTSALGNELYTYESGGEISLTEDYNTGTDGFVPVYGSYFNNKLYVSGDDGTGIGRELHVYQESQIKIVDITVSSNQDIDTDGIYDITAANNPIVLEYDLEDENGNELPSSTLANYNLIFNTLESTNKNTATKGGDFEALTNEQISVNTSNAGPDGNRTILMTGDGDFEADEYYSIEISTNDPNITLKNAENGVVRIPVRVIDNEVTNVDLELVNNGIEGSQDVRLRINSSLANATGADMPFSISLLNGTATKGADFDLTNTEVLLPNGQATIAFDIDVLTDTNTSEGLENFTATLSYSGSIDPNRVNIVNNSVTPTITDIPLVPVSATLSGIESAPSFEIQEGKSFTLEFNTVNPTIVGFIPFELQIIGSPTDYEVEGYFRDPGGNNFYAENNDEPDNVITFTALVDNSPDEEDILKILLPKLSEHFYWENGDAEGNRVFEIEIIDAPKVSSNPFKIQPTLKVDNIVIEESQLITVNEGQTFNIDVNALSPAAENYNYSISYDLNGSTANNNEDFILEQNPKGFIVQPGIEKDGTFEFLINNDFESEIDEKLIITLKPDPNNIYSWESDNLNTDGSITYELIIKNIEPPISNIISVVFDNSGGYEGLEDTFLLKLIDSQGNPWINNTGGALTFPISFSDYEIGIFELANNQNINQASIQILNGESEGSITLTLNTDEDSEREHYTVTVNTPITDLEFEALPQTIDAEIIDSEGKFYVTAIAKPNGSLKLITGDLDFETNCCRAYTIEEDKDLSIQFKAEKGVPEGVEYNFQASYGGDANEEDYQKIDLDDVLNGKVKLNTPFDNQFQLSINLDENNNEISDSGSSLRDYGESFILKFTSLEPDKYEINDPEGEGFSAEFFNIFLVDVVPVTLYTKPDEQTAIENPQQNAKFVAELTSPNSTGGDIFVNYEVIINSVEDAVPGQDYTITGLDYNTFKGTITIPFKEKSGTITLVPINDNKFELDENVTIRLLKGDSYGIKENDLAQITIKSEDGANYKAGLRSSQDNKSRESDSSDFAELIIELDKIPTEDIEVIIRISDKTDFQNVIEGSDYTIYQADKTTPITSENRIVLFKTGESKTKSIFVKALPDSELENNESLWLDLEAGINYSREAPNYAEVELISSDSDTSSFNPKDINLIAISPRCPGNDQEGEMFIENDSPFIYDVEVLGLEGIVYERTKILDKNDSDENFQTFKNMPIGSYKVSLKFKSNTSNTNPDVILPSYIIKISAFEGITVDEEGFDGDLVDLKVSGSLDYFVSLNKKTYSYNFSDNLEKTITIPLDQGMNTLQISGDAECKGVIEKNILLNKLFIYPNPAKETVSIFSNTLIGEIEILIFDLKGKLVYKENTSNNTNSIILNVSRLKTGLYLGKILDNNNNTIDFKLIKD